jgi:ATP-dependent 26S proteasome regulatory subunit
VFDDWGYDPRSDAPRGLTAVFHGPSGTGKAMAASVVARELDLELYRVDVARLARTAGAERTLDELFSAAEDGRLALLFTELDAGPLVDALASRLVAFDGLAILSTRRTGSIAPALDRLSAMRLSFPIPDETLRAQLWAAHVTPQIPTAGRLDFTSLARRFAQSGGDIRRCALRAAFLAAHDGSALTQSHLERAILLDIRDRRASPRGGSID